MIDAHCHLEIATYGDELDAVIARAFDSGLSHIVAVGSSGVTAGAREAIALTQRYDAIWATAGVHPHEAEKVTDTTFDEIAEYIAHPKVVALGEIGLDFYYDNSPREQQTQVFRRQLEMAREANIPIMLHVRDAHDECFALMDEVGLPERGGVVHCFSAGKAEAEAYLQRGFYLSIPGIVTFNKAEDLREAVRATPIERLLVETDSPYLAPMPHRGKRNEPAYVVETARRVAVEKEIEFDEAVSVMAENTKRLFGFS